VDFDTPARRATSTMVTRPTRSAASALGVSDISFTHFWNVPIFLSYQENR